jgi:hypothetical protein
MKESAVTDVSPPQDAPLGMYGNSRSFDNSGFTYQYLQEQEQAALLRNRGYGAMATVPEGQMQMLGMSPQGLNSHPQGLSPQQQGLDPQGLNSQQQPSLSNAAFRSSLSPQQYSSPDQGQNQLCRI